MQLKHDRADFKVRDCFKIWPFKHVTEAASTGDMEVSTFASNSHLTLLTALFSCNSPVLRHGIVAEDGSLNF